jgi:hypothetical protein
MMRLPFCAQVSKRSSEDTHLRRVRLTRSANLMHSLTKTEVYKGDCCRTFEAVALGIFESLRYWGERSSFT